MRPVTTTFMVLDSGRFEDRAEHAGRIEAFASNRASGGGMPRQIAGDPTDRIGSVVDGVNRVNASARRHHVGKPRVLDDDGSTRREVTDAPVAEPAGPKLDVHPLGRRELGFRADDVPAGTVVVDRYLERAANLPAGGAHPPFVLLNPADVHRHLEALAGPTREIEKFSPLEALSPMISPPANLEVAGLRIPTADHGDRRGARRVVGVPEIGDHRRTRRPPG